MIRRDDRKARHLVVHWSIMITAGAGAALIRVAMAVIDRGDAVGSR